MGMLDFVKNAGAKIFGRDEPKATASAPAPSGVEIAQARAKALRAAVASYGFEVEGFNVSVSGEVATISGKVADQATRERVALVVGNTNGIARVDDRLEVVTPEPEAQFYTVVSGDTLSKIAKQFYGKAMKYPVIFEANRPMLENPDKIYPGQVLRIPALDD